MTTPPEHPGFITLYDKGDESTKEVAASEMPEESRFVAVRTGPGRDAPFEIVPVVRVVFTPMDKFGRIVTSDLATDIDMKLYGAGGQLLRASTMRRDPPSN
jgi:hypothetical protein